MLHLSLLRHAKSSWDDPELSDHERQLTKRGIKAAIAIGRHIESVGLIPELILCSDAARTRATLTLLLQELGIAAPPTTITEELYLADPDTILRVVEHHAARARHVMVIGHNPGLHDLALSLSSGGKRKDLAAVALKFPTAALAHITFAVDKWADLSPATGHLTHYITPRTLPA